MKNLAGDWKAAMLTAIWTVEVHLRRFQREMNGFLAHSCHNLMKDMAAFCL